MGQLRIEATNLWQSSLAPRDGDPHSAHRDRLRTALLNMRENAIPFVRNIHRDVLGLTVHDESHLDALWETADVIAGADFQITPVEAFTFGASVLLHDTGMAIATFPGGIDELKESNAWRDAEDAMIIRQGYKSRIELNETEKRSILFSVLRKYHAAQAENLLRFTYSRPGRTESIPLLADNGLRDALGRAIGRIAHSHHWDSAELPKKLVTIDAGALPGFPTSWTLNELKVATLLRCADAAHIDALRAPTMLFSISDIEGDSIEHWNFQNKLNAVTVSRGKLVYYSGQEFSIEEANSWWLAHDTMAMIDNELKSSNALLEEAGKDPFEASGVYGIDSPRLLSKTVHVAGWTPISAEVRVSDPVHLARTLGGRNLYGQGAIAPIRELLQNAVDAVRARRSHERRDKSWGKIRLIIEKKSSQNQEIWLHVDDNGIGMSERVLTGPLIDFGKSFWSSSLIENEFPGLRRVGTNLIGKFGIGFFSIFLLGDEVSVASRRFNDAEGDALVLSFNQLARRPLLRPAVTGEIPQDYITRISVKLNDNVASILSNNNSEEDNSREVWNISNDIAHLISSVDVDVELINRLTGSSRTHAADWLNCPSEQFLSEVCAKMTPTDYKDFLDKHVDRVRLITEDDGEIMGRAVLALPGTHDRNIGMAVSVGGFSVSQTRSSRDYFFDEDVDDEAITGLGNGVGVVIGDTIDAARTRAVPRASKIAVARWAEEQESLLDVETITPLEQLSICHSLIRLGIRPQRLPFAFLGNKLSTVPQIIDTIMSHDFCDILMSYEDYRNDFSFKEIGKLTPPYFFPSPQR